MVAKKPDNHEVSTSGGDYHEDNKGVGQNSGNLVENARDVSYNENNNISFVLPPSYLTLETVSFIIENLKDLPANTSLSETYSLLATIFEPKLSQLNLTGKEENELRNAFKESNKTNLDGIVLRFKAHADLVKFLEASNRDWLAELMAYSTHELIAKYFSYANYEDFRQNLVSCMGFYLEWLETSLKRVNKCAITLEDKESIKAYPQEIFNEAFYMLESKAKGHPNLGSQAVEELKGYRNNFCKKVWGT